MICFTEGDLFVANERLFRALFKALWQYRAGDALRLVGSRLVVRYARTLRLAT